MYLYGVDTDEPMELYHHGIKGMKWGVRRYQNEDGSLTSAGRKRYSSMETHETKNGEKVTVGRHHDAGDEKEYTIYNGLGKKAGKIWADAINNSDGKELNINYMHVKKEDQGKGYGQKAMDTVIGHAKKEGFKKVTLEVPNDDDRAMNMCLKKGFKKGTAKKDNVTEMELNLDELREKEKRK